MTSLRNPEAAASRADRDGGMVLIFVLVAVIMISLISIPILSYVRTAFRAGEVQAERTQAVELANGGVWVALSNERDLYALCPEPAQPPAALPSSLDGVDVSCQLLDEAQLRPANEMPLEVAVIGADATIPAGLESARPASAGTANFYANPSTAADAGAWLADRASRPTEDTVWLPQLPVRTESAGQDRDTTMPAGTFDTASYATCRVLFPGTFDDPLVIDGPTYLTSGVYYFTAPIVLRDGADVAVGNGAEAGCTNDFEAVALANDVPEPLNMSGLGGTLVLGGDARIVVDDSGGDPIRFAINQRYVSADETSVAASSDVAIVSVNGSHAPFLPGETAGDPLFLPGVLDVPASTVDTDGDASAVAVGYAPSTLTPKPAAPGVPTITSAEAFRIGSDGRLTVTWTEPADNGAPIEAYVLTDSVTGQTCRTAAPLREGLAPLPSCTLRNLPHGTDADVSVVAYNASGPSDPSPVVDAPAVWTGGGGAATEVANPTPAPTGATIGTAYSDGLEVTWTSPTPVAGAPITYTEVRATDVLTGGVVTCQAWWTESSCILRASDGLTASAAYDIAVRSIVVDGDYERVYTATAPWVGAASGFVFTPGSGAAPTPMTVTPGPRAPDPIVDLTTTTGVELDIVIDGYVAVPQGSIAIDVAAPASATISFSGGLVASSIDVGTAPTQLFEMYFDNPVAQKRVRILSSVAGTGIRADAVIQVNRSGSLAINSWVVGVEKNTTTPAPSTGPGDGSSTGGDGDADDTPYVDAYTGGGNPAVDYTAGWADAGPVEYASCEDDTRWSARYWSNDALAGAPDVARCEGVVDWDWGGGVGPTGVAEDFTARWTKTIGFATSDVYRFRIIADDGARLWVDGQLIHDQWADGFTNRTEQVALTAGEHVIELEYYESAGNARAALSWAVVPPASLFQTSNDAVATGDFVTDGTGWGVPNGIGNNTVGASATTSSLTFTFEVAEAGDYAMRGAVNAPTGGDNSFWVTATGSPADGWQWRFDIHNSYTSEDVSDHNGDNPQLVTLPVGTHDVTLHHREDGAYIESLELVKQ